MNTNTLPNIIIDGQDTIINNTDVVIDGNESNDTSNEEKTFYSKLNMYKESLKYPEKVMISFDYYQNIIQCLKQPKSGKAIGIDAKFHFWCKKHFKIDMTSGIEMLCSVKNGRRIVVIESYFVVLKDIHKKTGHGARDKMRHEMNEHYYWMPTQVIDIFLQCCTSCIVRKSFKLPVTPSAIVSVGFLTRLQIDLIDFRTRPDKDSQWILHCRDHYSKYSWGYALISKEAQRIADHLLSLFYQFGPCKILQSDNGREFTASVIKNLKNFWPGLIIINGRPRHPESQGLVERGNATLCQILGKLMEDQNTTCWTTCLLPAIYSMNTSLARGVNMTPYQIVFGQKPRLDHELWKLIEEQDIEFEEDLPASIRESLAGDGTSESTEPSQATQPIQEPEPPQATQPIQEPEPTQVIDTSNNSSNVETKQFDEQTDDDITSTTSRHSEIRKRATKTYLSNANKKIKIHDEFIKDLSLKCLIGEYVGIKINKVDRTNTDPKILPVVVLEKKDDKIKVACEFGIINQWWSLDSVALLSTVPENLVNLQKNELKEIYFITASRLFVRGGINGVTCSCKGGCKTKQCPCRKKSVPCSTKCHKNGVRCVNLELDDKI
ncbi:unnamed protein product [Rotaria magnacalcarata]|uniref:Integrase catalytic domain-containing protein n=2 Tax=Rotaria magnacalcarata TaxID=392030 RepID=A0A816W0A3_9BILA|nr:unnamed protein product [Rotaria magnacalcarata]